MLFFVLSFHNIQSVTFHRTQMLQLQPSVNCGKKTKKPHLYTRLNCMLLLWCSPLRFFSPIYGFLWSIKCTRLSLSHTLLIHILSFAFTKIKTQTFHSFFFYEQLVFGQSFCRYVVFSYCMVLLVVKDCGFKRRFMQFVEVEQKHGWNLVSCG